MAAYWEVRKFASIWFRFVYLMTQFPTIERKRLNKRNHKSRRFNDEIYHLYLLSDLESLPFFKGKFLLRKLIFHLTVDGILRVWVRKNLLRKFSRHDKMKLFTRTFLATRDCVGLVVDANLYKNTKAQVLQNIRGRKLSFLIFH